MASGYYSSITFKTGTGSESQAYKQDVPSLDDSQDYTMCKVSKLTGDGAVWIIYGEKNYGSTRGDSQSFVVPPTETKWIMPGFSIRSAQAFNITQPCICVFEYTNYKGSKLATCLPIEDIKKKLSTVQGISSCVATSGLWSVWTKPDNEGNSQKVDASNGITTVPFFEELKNLAQSVKLI